jgi:hypothetical protein
VGAGGYWIGQRVNKISQPCSGKRTSVVGEKGNGSLHIINGFCQYSKLTTLIEIMQRIDDSLAWQMVTKICINQGYVLLGP